MAPRQRALSAREQRRRSGQVRVPGNRTVRYAHHMVGESPEEQGAIVSEMTQAVSADIRGRGLAIKDVSILLVDGDDVERELQRVVPETADATRAGMERTGVRRMAVLVVECRPIVGGIPMATPMHTRVSQAFSAARRKAKAAASERVGPDVDRNRPGKGVRDDFGD